MIRVLHVIVGLDVGGAELMLSRLVSAHCASGAYRHEVITLTTVGTIGPKLQEMGIEVTPLGMRSPLQFPSVLWRLAALIRRRKPDVVQTWMYHSDLLGGLGARLAGVRNVLWGIRTTDVESGGTRSTSVVMALCAFLSRTIPREIICAAEAARDTHVRAGYDAGRMVVVPNGFNVAGLMQAAANRDAKRRELGIGADDLVVGTVGRFDPAKDHRNFVAAAGLAAARHPQVRFLMVGRGLDESNAELMDWIAASGAPGRFILLGQRSDVPDCLAAMDVFCLSSLSEGFPNVIGEAMSVALPCVSTRVGDAALLVGDTGVLVAKEDPQALATGLGQVLGMTQAARRALGLRAQARVAAEFTIERSREKFEAIYQRVTEKGRR